MKINRTSNIQHSTPNVELMPGRGAVSLDVGSRIAGLNVECFRPSRPGLQPSAFSLQPSRRGVALIITLILLSVVLFMALTFMALSRRDRGAVTTVTDTASARYAADAALANAEVQIIANVLATTNPYNFSLLVSTNARVDLWTNVNFLAVGNFLPDAMTNLYVLPRAPVLVSTNEPVVGRFYLDLNRNGRFDTNGYSLVISPDPANPYYDLNGNPIPSILPGNTLSNFQVGDPEWIGILERPDVPYGPNNKFIARYAFIAVPVGNTLDLNAIHNQVLTRSVLDPNDGNDGYFRNQGVGSWEINLAAFLADLNTNKWNNAVAGSGGVYQYLQAIPPVFPNAGVAFFDAFSILRYRYNYDYGTLDLAGKLFANLASIFPNDNIDGYSDGPLQMTFNTNETFLPDVPSRLWAGANNTNHYFTHQELFNSNEISAGFVNRLLAAGQTNSTYDRYTFYRLLSQLGTDSAPESDKMNLNYDNLDPTNGVVASTNFLAWEPVTFFTNAADRLIRAYTAEWRRGNPTNFAATFYAVTDFNSLTVDQWTNFLPFGVANIPVLVSNQFVYSPAVNRLLQLAANLYDATTNNAVVLLNQGINYPSVFRPTFWVTNEFGYRNVYINGFVDISRYSSQVALAIGTAPLDTPVDASDPTLVTNAAPQTALGNVYGVPWIIGAKKGFPNFNKFGIQNTAQVTRKLQIRRSKIPIGSISDFEFTNQLYVFNITNLIGVDCWNSYSNAYPNKVQIVVDDRISMMLTNDSPGSSSVVFPPSSLPPSYPPKFQVFTNILLAGPWPGSAPWTPSSATGDREPNHFSFVVPLDNATTFLTNSVLYFGGSPPGVGAGFYPVGLNLGWETNKHDFTFPHFGLLTTNRLQAFMLDGNHVIDYVQFAGPDSSRDLNAEIQSSVSGTSSAPSYQNMWSTSFNANGVPWGIVSQIQVSQGDPGLNSLYWSDGWANDAILGFTSFMSPTGGAIPGNSTANFYATNYIVQVPYTPTITMYQYTSWQANDPFVHYLTSDLSFQGAEAGGTGPKTGINILPHGKDVLPRPSFTNLNDRYQPWGVTPLAPTGVDTNTYNLSYKDPLVRMSDNWDFPTNRFPNVGWIGRVHRGTPWQTVYLKAANVLGTIHMRGSTPVYVGTNTWAYWTGNTNPIGTTYTAPVQDRLLFDLFTTAFNDNATRGTLSVNQSAGSSDPLAGLAAWSALFSGVTVVSNTVRDTALPGQGLQNQYPSPAFSGTNIIQPAGLFAPTSPLGILVTNINRTRTNFVNPDGIKGTFEHVGDILAVPMFTEQSPFLRVTSAQQQNGISDEMYEWLPQQTMGLLRCSSSPRYVIYCYGQALKPAPNAVVSSGPLFGMVTNYQVVSEIGARAVVRFTSLMTNTVVTTNYFNGASNVLNWFTVPQLTNNGAVIENFNPLPPD